MMYKGVYITFNSFGIGKVIENSYLNNNIIGVIVVSEDSLRYLKYVFNERLIINRIKNKVDTYGIIPDYCKKDKKITLIMKDRIKDLIQIINILKIRNNLKGYSFDVIQNETHKNLLLRLEKNNN